MTYQAAGPEPDSSVGRLCVCVCVSHLFIKITLLPIIVH